MDTWATSSLTPQIAGHWDDDPDLFSRVFPMDVRPQGPEIIRTWLFSTVLRSHYEHGALPWSHASVNGWILDPDRKKMSKSRGNVITPLPLIEEYGAEAVRYWACNGRPGADTAVDYGVMKIGRRLALKILNAARFVLGFSDDVGPDAIVAPIDRSMIAALDRVVSEATEAFDRFDYARALETTESSFWDWTDDYLELVKGRAYDGGSAGASAHAALCKCRSVPTCDCSPRFSPSSPRRFGRGGARDPCIASHGLTHAELGPHVGESAVFPLAQQTLATVRRAKSEAKVSMATSVESFVVRGSRETLDLVRQAEPDLLAATRSSLIEFQEGDPFWVGEIGLLLS